MLNPVDKEIAEACEAKFPSGEGMWGSFFVILITVLALIDDKLGDKYKDFIQAWAAYGVRNS